MILRADADLSGSQRFSWLVQEPSEESVPYPPRCYVRHADADHPYSSALTLDLDDPETLRHIAAVCLAAAEALDEAKRKWDPIVQAHRANDIPF